MLKQLNDMAQRVFSKFT